MSRRNSHHLFLTIVLVAFLPLLVLAQSAITASDSLMRQDSAAHSTAKAIPDSLPPLVNPTAASPVDLRSNMVWVEGRAVSWTLPDAAGRPGKKSDIERQSPGFYMDRTEVTNRQFAQFLSAADSHAVFYDPRMDIVQTERRRFLPRAGMEDYPVAWVDWMAAYAFAAWAGKSLPTEDEWIIAALAGRDLKGNGALLSFDEMLNAETTAKSSPSKPFPGCLAVGSLPQRQTSAGICDLAGNLAEWTSTEVTSPLASGGKTSWLAVKGGSFLDAPGSMSALGRTLHLRSERLSSLGFRCILRAPHTP
jgi:formylglycine-generating enzyme required for sulfatase activity